ncbi:MAG TPA: ATP-binding cassette domain-containing protein [Actinocatenispora sp.]
MLTTLAKADGGTVRVEGHDVATDARAVRAAIRVTGQFAAVDELLTGRENLQLMLDLVPGNGGRRLIGELLERFDLVAAAQKPATTYSGGMRRKLDLTNLIAIAAIVGVAFLLGFRPAASLHDWLGVVGLVVLLAISAGWLTVALGLAAKSPETAGMAAVPLVMLPFFSSAIVAAEKMGPGVRQFAEYQPFTPIIETVRGLLDGAPSAGTASTAVAWCVGIALVGYLRARATFTRRA